MVEDLNQKARKIIVLTGIMGSGKTTIGTKLAEKLGFYFIDSDQEIEDFTKKSITKIFDSDGEAYFRKIENKIVKEIINRDEPMVLSLGGGAFMDKELRDLIKERAISIWLHADLDVLLHRIAAKNTRPLLNNVDKRLTLNDLIKKRVPIYKQSDIHIDTSRDNHDTIIKVIVEKIDDLANQQQLSQKIVKVSLPDPSKNYEIIIGSNIIGEIEQHITKIANYSKIIIVTDDNVKALHLDKLLSALNQTTQVITVQHGEKAKSFDNLQDILEKILAHNIDRHTLLIAFGGGVVGDLCGFAASILLRGIDFIQVPTTLLSAVDSSVGGKTGINSKFGKNLIGSFYQPKLVFCDLDFLDTLPKREFISGYAEVIKYGLITDQDFFFYLNDNVEAIKNRHKQVLQNIIVRSCQIKAEVVGKDEKENNLRAILNFGHTFGHTLETETGYSEQLLHGEAVAIGMILAARMSVNLKILDKNILPIIMDHFDAIGLPTTIKSIKKSWNIDNLIVHLYKDKKVNNKNLTFILLSDIGSSVIEKNVEEKEFLKVMADC